MKSAMYSQINEYIECQHAELCVVDSAFQRQSLKPTVVKTGEFKSVTFGSSYEDKQEGLGLLKLALLAVCVDGGLVTLSRKCIKITCVIVFTVLNPEIGEIQWQIQTGSVVAVETPFVSTGTVFTHCWRQLVCMPAHSVCAVCISVGHGDSGQKAKIEQQHANIKDAQIKIFHALCR